LKGILKYHTSPTQNTSSSSLSSDSDVSKGGARLSANASRYDKVDMLIQYTVVYTVGSNAFLAQEKIVKSGSGSEL